MYVHTHIRRVKNSLHSGTHFLPGTAIGGTSFPNNRRPMEITLCSFSYSRIFSLMSCATKLTVSSACSRHV